VQLYRDLGYTVLPLVAKHDVAPLRPLLQRHSSVLVGQSGMGKSTIINRLVPSANAATGDVSIALDSGRHTTTYARLYRLDADRSLIDSPGLQEFGLMHLSMPDLQQAFVEFRPHLGHCRFNDCAHVGEPDCAIQKAAELGQIDERRLSVYRRLAQELARKPQR
jgi:ribosome biogenesis GTPase